MASVILNGRGDPARDIKGSPPNFGLTALPQVFTFQGIVSSISKVYRASDEAIRHSYDNARFMRNDPIIEECVEQRRRSVALLDWHLEPDDQEDMAQVDMCDELKVIIERTPYFTQYRQSLLQAIWYGRYANQHRFCWKKIRAKMRLCANWLPVHGDKLVFRYDQGDGKYDPDQVGIRVGAAAYAGTENRIAGRWAVEKIEPTDFGLAYFLEPWERCLLAIHRHLIEDGEYEDPASAGRIHGKGIRSVLYWAWMQKQETLAWLMEFLERSAFGIEIWTFPMGNAEAETKARKAAEERIGGGRNIIMAPVPMGDDGGMNPYGVTRLETNMAGAEVVQKIVTDYFGHMIKRYILGQTLTTEAGSTGLGSNLASIHLDTYLQIVQYDAVNLEETMTTDFLAPLKAFNFPKYADVPVRFKIDTQAADVESKLKAYEAAFNMGLKIPAQEVMDLIGSGTPDEGEEVLQNPAFAQQGLPGSGGLNGAPGGGAVPQSWNSSSVAADAWKALSAQDTADDAAKALGVDRPQDGERMKMLAYARDWEERCQSAA